MRRRLNDLGRKIGQQLRPVYVSPKLKDRVMKQEPKLYLQIVSTVRGILL